MANTEATDLAAGATPPTEAEAIANVQAGLPVASTETIPRNG